MSLCLLVVDSDLGFAFWLAQVLDDAGYEAFPARETQAALVLLHEMPPLQSNLRMIIIRSDQPGARHLIAQCRRSQPGLRVIWLRDPADGLAEEPETHDIQLFKPADAAAPECKALLVTIERLLALRPTG